MFKWGKKEERRVEKIDRFLWIRLMDDSSLHNILSNNNTFRHQSSSGQLFLVFVIFDEIAFWSNFRIVNFIYGKEISNSYVLRYFDWGASKLWSRVSNLRYISPVSSVCDSKRRPFQQECSWHIKHLVRYLLMAFRLALGVPAVKFLDAH